MAEGLAAVKSGFAFILFILLFGMLNNQLPAQTYGFGSSQSNQSLQVSSSITMDSLPPQAPPPLTSNIQDLLKRIVDINGRLGRVYSLLRYIPESNSLGKDAPLPGDVTSTVIACHQALTYAQGVLSDIEATVGV